MRAFNLQNQKGHPYITAQDATINFTGNVKKNNSALTTSNELNAAVDRLEAEIAGMASVSFRSVDTLPETGESNVIYLVPKDSTTPTDIKNEYIWVDNKWELIGNTEIDLSTKQDKLHIYEEDVDNNTATFKNGARVIATQFESGPLIIRGSGEVAGMDIYCDYPSISLTDKQSNSTYITQLSIDTGVLRSSSFTCGPVRIDDTAFVCGPVRINTVFACGPLKFDDTAFVCGPVRIDTVFACGPLKFDDTAFVCGPVRIDAYDTYFTCGPLQVDNTGFKCGPVEINSGFKCGPVRIDTAFACGPLKFDDTAFVCGPVQVDNTGFKCGPVEIDTAFVCGPLQVLGSLFTCGPVYIEGRNNGSFICGQVLIDTAFVCGPVEMLSEGMRINPITIHNNTNQFIRHQQICEVNVQGSSTFNLTQLQLDAYCTAEIWLTYNSSATAAVQFPSNWYWLDTASSTTPPTFQQGWKYFIVIRNDNYRILARVADSYNYNDV